MNEKVLHTLEYNKILDQLTEYAFSADARSRCQKLRPITDRAQIEQLQQQTILKNAALAENLSSFNTVVA